LSGKTSCCCRRRRNQKQKRDSFNASIPIIIDFNHHHHHHQEVSRTKTNSNQRNLSTMGCEQSLPVQNQVDPTFINKNVGDGSVNATPTGNSTVATVRSNRSTPSTFHGGGGGDSCSPPHRLSNASSNNDHMVVIEGVPDDTRKNYHHSMSWSPSNNNFNKTGGGGGGGGTSSSITSSPGVSVDTGGGLSDEDVIVDLPQLDPDGNLMPSEIVRRTSSSVMTSSISIGNKTKGGKSLKMQYAYRSQRGYYPDHPLKPNQDKYGITLKFAGEEGDAIFSVFDGHGDKGHECANFTKTKLPQALAKYVRQKRVQRYSEKLQKNGNSKKKGAWNPKEWPLLSTTDFEEACKKAFREANKSLREDKKISDALSGTTAASACFHGGRMTVCHVGDSRVVLGRRVARAASYPSDNYSATFNDQIEEEKYDEDEMMSRKEDSLSHDARDIIAVPLTRDQTPYRKDERERLSKMGAEIKTVAQMEGNTLLTDDWEDIPNGSKIHLNGADPPRVWSPGKSWPGCAFTRSIGDSLAEEIGVCSEPEIMTKELTANDEFLVIASDGLFEFMTDQEVINICSACNNPLQACEMLTKASYDKWIQHDTRCDDISVIVCFLSSTFVPSPTEVDGTTDDLDCDAPLPIADSKTATLVKPIEKQDHQKPRITEIFSPNTTEAGHVIAEAAAPKMVMEMDDFPDYNY